MRAALAGAILGFVPGLLDVFASPKAALLRVLGLPLLVLAGAGAVAAARRDGFGAWRPRDAASLADLAALAWVAIGCASALAGLSPRTSLWGETGQREGVLTTLAFAGLWFGARGSHTGPAHVRGTLVVAFAAAALAGFVALAQFAGLDPLVWANPTRYGGVLRPPGPLGNPILLGAVMAAATAGAAAALAGGHAPASRIAPGLVLTAAALVVTLSRGAWLAAAVGLAVATVPGLARPDAGARRRAAIALALAILPALAFGALAVGGEAAARLAEGGSPDASSAPARAAIARGALELWRAHPWLGTGPDTFGLAFTRVQDPELWRGGWFGLPLHAHSAVLQVLATLGTLGALALLAWGAVTLRAWRASRTAGAADAVLPAVAAALVAAALVNPLGLAGAAVLVVVAALAAGAAGARPLLGTGRAATAIALLVAVIAALAGARELSAHAAAGHARGALLDAGTLPPELRESASVAGLEAARRAARAWPADDELARLECDAIVARLALRGPGFPPAAAESLAREGLALARAAVRAVPARAANRQRLADALAALALVTRESGRGGAEAAVGRMTAAFDSAQALAPADGMLLVDRARAELSLGLAPEALATAGRIVRLYPEAATGHALVAAAHLLRDEREPARAALVRALAARWEEGSEMQRAQAEWLLGQLGPPAR